MPCQPAPPCEPTFPIFCEPLPTTTDGRRIVVEDSASCQKTIATTPFPSVLKTTNTGAIEWEGGSTGSVLSYTTAGNIEFVDGSNGDPLKLPSIATHTLDNVAKTLVMLSDGTVKVWEPTNVGNNFLAYWDGSDWRINTLNNLLPSGSGTVFIRDNNGNLQAISGSSNDILTMVGSTPQFVTPSSGNPFPAGHLYGMILSNNVTTPNTELDISSGECRDSSGSENIVLSSSLTKTTTGSFVAGTGQPGLLGTTTSPTGVTTLHILAIKGANGVDIGFNSQPTIALTSLPTGYDQFYRRIGSITTDASGFIRLFVQFSDRFLYTATPLKLTNQTISTGGTTLTLPGIPTGIRVFPIYNAASETDVYWKVYDLSQTFQASWAPDNTNVGATAYLADSRASNYGLHGFYGILTNTSAQVGIDVSANVSSNFDVDVHGWFDMRNRLQP